MEQQVHHHLEEVERQLYHVEVVEEWRQLLAWVLSKELGMLRGTHQESVEEVRPLQAPEHSQTSGNVDQESEHSLGYHQGLGLSGLGTDRELLGGQCHKEEALGHCLHGNHHAGQDKASAYE